MTDEVLASADDSIEEELHAEGIRHGLALKWQDADGTTQSEALYRVRGLLRRD